MRVVAVTEKNVAKVLEIPKPVPAPNEVLIRIKACALCTFEQRVFSQTTKKALPYVGGHEIFGTIEDLGAAVDRDDFPIGTNATVRILKNCGYCHYCRHNRENLCLNSYKKSAAMAGQLLPNGLGEYIAVNATQVYCFAQDVQVESGVLAEPLACVVNSIENANIGLGDDVLILGGGVMGVLHVKLAKLRGAKVYLSEPDEKRAEMGRLFGADRVINPLEEDIREQVNRFTKGKGMDVVINTTANYKVAQQAVELTAQMGRCIFYSSMHPDEPIPISANQVHNSEMIITGSKSPSVQSFERAVNLISKKVIDLSPLLTESYPAEQAQTAFERAMSMETYRVMVTF